MTQVLLRLLLAIPTLFGVVIVTFLLTRILPGDPAVFFASNPGMNAADIQALRETLGLDQSLMQQFWIYLRGLLHGDLGRSISTGLPVTTELVKRLPASAELTALAFLIATCTGIPLGVMAALRPGSLIDHIARILAVIGVSLPTFVIGLLLIHVFYFRLGIAPEPIGRLDPFIFPPPQITGFLMIDAALAGEFQTLRAALGRLMLPALTMAVFALPPLIRITRGAMIAALGSDYTRTARANGLARRQIIWTYAFRNALLPIVTSLGMVLAFLLGANMLVEKVFAWPGIGAFALDSLLGLDYAPLQGFMLLVAAFFICINLATDIAIALIDPRIAE